MSEVASFPLGRPELYLIFEEDGTPLAIIKEKSVGDAVTAAKKAWPIYAGTHLTGKLMRQGDLATAALLTLSMLSEWLILQFWLMEQAGAGRIINPNRRPM